MKKDVIKIGVIKGFDDTYMWRIEYQDEDIFPRGEFIDEELRVMSESVPDYDEEGYLYLRGTEDDYDYDVMVVSSEELDEIKRIIDKLNEKYGIKMSPRDYYSTLKKLKFVHGEDNWYVVYDTYDERYDTIYTSCNNREEFGGSYISKEDAIKFCKIFNEVK